MFKVKFLKRAFKIHTITDHNYQNIFQAANIVSREILAEGKWQLNGSYDGFNVPRSLERLYTRFCVVREKTLKQEQRYMKLTH